MIEGPGECGRTETTISAFTMEFYHPLLDQMSNTEEARKMLRIEYSGDILTCLVIYVFSKNNFHAILII